ncbi:MAG: tetratricopeptide repeat protein [Sphingobacteriales bacterium]|nr:MAG: tetratricopeptide repeat protein [Sphingobacteriales bacterium]
MKAFRKTVTRLFFIGVLCASVESYAQGGIQELEKEAFSSLALKDYKSAMPLLNQLFQMAPYDKKYYDSYYKALIEVKSYDTAIALSQYMTRIRKEDLSVWVDKGQAELLKGDKKAAAKTFQAAIELQAGNEFQTNTLAAAFRFLNYPDYEISTYEAYQQKTGNPYAFSYELAVLYDAKGETDKAFEMLLLSLAARPYGMENAKQAMEKVIDNNPKKQKKATTVIARKLKEEPGNYLWRELFTWLQSGKGDKSEQLKDIIRHDTEQGQGGKMVFNWAAEQYQKEEWEHALQALDYLGTLPLQNPLRPSAMQARLDIRQKQLEQTFPVAAENVTKILSEYHTFFTEYPDLKNGKAILGYARTMALYADQPQAAIDTLQACINLPYIPGEIKGEAQLDMGDYQVLVGNVWQAALLYSQVDKSFKEDMLGEEARFRNAKLSYYRGDFEYAQGQLSVLKASTTELIANDALYLSVLITENTPEDKNFEALGHFAKADLLQFRHKYAEADQLLDSLTKAYPDNDLQDDIHLQRAGIAMKMQDYDKAVVQLKIIQEQYGDDVLADDACMRLAEIFEQKYKDNEKARATYENLIIKYPGSSFVQQARARFEALSNPKT